jgi:hypothetical protein
MQTRPRSVEQLVCGAVRAPNGLKPERALWPFSIGSVEYIMKSNEGSGRIPKGGAYEKHRRWIILRRMAEDPTGEIP